MKYVFILLIIILIVCALWNPVRSIHESFYPWNAQEIAKDLYTRPKIGFQNSPNNISTSMFVNKLQDHIPGDYISFESLDKLYNSLQRGYIDIAFVPEYDAHLYLSGKGKYVAPSPSVLKERQNIKFLTGMFDLYFPLIVDHFKWNLDDSRSPVGKVYNLFKDSPYQNELTLALQSHFERTLNLAPNPETPYFTNIDGFLINDITTNYDAVIYPTHYPSKLLNDITKNYNTNIFDFGGMDMNAFFMLNRGLQMKSMDLQFLPYLINKNKRSNINVIGTRMIAITMKQTDKRICDSFLEKLYKSFLKLQDSMPFTIYSFKGYRHLFSTNTALESHISSTQFFTKMGYIQTNSSELCRYSLDNNCEPDVILRSISLGNS